MGKRKPLRGIFNRNGIYWIRYSAHGRQIRESSKSTILDEAIKLLDLRRGEVAQGLRPSLYYERVTFAEIMEGFLDDYEIQGHASLKRARQSVEHLKAYFKKHSVVEITGAYITKYIKARQKEKAKNSTINRELAALKRALSLGVEHSIVDRNRIPQIKALAEHNVRKGFFERDQFLALRKALPEYLKGFCTFGYKTGWRVSEIQSLTWNQIDRQQGIARLEGDQTKNKEARTIYLDTELRDVIQAQWDKRTSLEIPYVFPNREGKGPIRDFRGAWKAACKKAGLEGKIFHDFRRTTVRNLVRSGIPESIAMKVTGHKTASVFRRYDIKSDADMREAAQKQEAYIKNLDSTKEAQFVRLPAKEENR